MDNKKWNEQIFYHGTNDPDFEKFDPKLIGSAHDRGWYGSGFYFCFSEGEASYYGRHVRKAKLDIKNPFFFSEELETMEGQSSDIFGDLAIFAIQLSEKFPELAKQITLSVVPSFDSDGNGIVEEISFPEYAKKVNQIFQGSELQIYPCWDREKVEYRYRYKDDYNCTFHRFETEARAREARISVAAYFVNNNVYSHVDGHIPTYFMQDIAVDFSKELTKRGFDSILQSQYGDEVICFSPEQVEWIKD